MSSFDRLNLLAAPLQCREHRERSGIHDAVDKKIKQHRVEAESGTGDDADEHVPAVGDG